MITTASYITLCRIVLIGPIVWAIFMHHLTAALFLSILAGITDILDGYVARKYQQQSQLGALLDPVADKLLMVSIFTTLWYCYDNSVPAWFIYFLWGKELFLLGGAGFLLLGGHKPHEARISGKIAMAGQVFYSFLLFFTRYTCLHIPVIMTSILCIVAVMTLYALLDYGKEAFFLFHKK